MSSPELHDTHAVGDEPEPVTAADYNAAIATIMERPADSPLSLHEVKQICRVLEAGRHLAGARIVPADAIVLERPTKTYISDLEERTGHLNPVRLLVPGESGFKGTDPQVHLTLRSSGVRLFPSHARTLAALLCVMADKAEEVGQ